MVINEFVSLYYKVGERQGHVIEKLSTFVTSKGLANIFKPSSIMKKLLLLLLSAVLTTVSNGQTVYQKDFDYFIQTVKDNYAYFDQQKTNWGRVKEIYQQEADKCNSREGLIHLFEKMLNELYNGHNFLNTNTASSNRLIPSGSDMKLVWKNGDFIIDELREGYNASLCGLKKGMKVTRVGNLPVQKAIRPYLPLSFTDYDQAVYEYAGNMAVAEEPSRQNGMAWRKNISRTPFPTKLKADRNPCSNGNGSISIRGTSGSTTPWATATW